MRIEDDRIIVRVEGLKSGDDTLYGTIWFGRNEIVSLDHSRLTRLKYVRHYLEDDIEYMIIFRILNASVHSVAEFRVREFQVGRILASNFPQRMKTYWRDPPRGIKIESPAPSVYEHHAPKLGRVDMIRAAACACPVKKGS